MCFIALCGLYDIWYACMAFGMHIGYALFGLRRSQKRGFAQLLFQRLGGFFALKASLSWTFVKM
jgi:hypothetical protein